MVLEKYVGEYFSEFWLVEVILFFIVEFLSLD